MEEYLGLERFVCSLYNERILEFQVIPEIENERYLFKNERCIFVSKSGEDEIKIYLDILKIEFVDVEWEGFDRKLIEKLKDSQKNYLKILKFHKEGSTKKSKKSFENWDYESRVIGGHSYHCLHKMRWNLSEEEVENYSSEYGKILEIALVEFLAKDFNCYGEFKKLINQIYSSDSSFPSEEDLMNEKYLYLPVHPFQLKKLPEMGN